LLDERCERGDLLWMAGQVKAADCCEHRSGVIPLDLSPAGVKQGFSQEAFVNEDAVPVGERDAVSGEARKARGKSPSVCEEVTRRAAVGDHQASALFHEPLLVCERFGDV
jgi:hypothetical protein